jgi:hypothetical protein
VLDQVNEAVVAATLAVGTASIPMETTIAATIDVAPRPIVFPVVQTTRNTSLFDGIVNRSVPADGEGRHATDRQ